MNDVKEKPAATRNTVVRLTEDPRNEAAALIINMPLFQDLASDEIDLLARYVKLCPVREGTVIFEEGEEGTFLILIVEGFVEVSKRNAAQKSVKISSESIGRMLGEMSIVDGEPRSATARFVGNGTMLTLSRENFVRILRQHPRLAVSLLMPICRQLSQKLRRTTGILTNYL